MNICVHTYTNMYTHSFYMLNFFCVQRHSPHHPTRNVLGMCFWKPCRSYILHGFCLMLNIHYDGFHGWNRPQKCLHSLLHLNRFQIHIHFVWGHNVFQKLIFIRFVTSGWPHCHCLEPSCMKVVTLMILVWHPNSLLLLYSLHEMSTLMIVCKRVGVLSFPSSAWQQRREWKTNKAWVQRRSWGRGACVPVFCVFSEGNYEWFSMLKYASNKCIRKCSKYRIRDWES